jgi:uncharacterized protein YpmS
MTAINLIEFSLFVLIPVSLIFFVSLAAWIEHSNHPIAVEERRRRNAESFNTEYDDDDHNHTLESEMTSYYELRNFDRRIGKD